MYVDQRGPLTGISCFKNTVHCVLSPAYCALHTVPSRGAQCEEDNFRDTVWLPMTPGTQHVLTHLSLCAHLVLADVLNAPHA